MDVFSGSEVVMDMEVAAEEVVMQDQGLQLPAGVNDTAEQCSLNLLRTSNSEQLCYPGDSSDDEYGSEGHGLTVLTQQEGDYVRESCLKDDCLCWECGKHFQSLDQLMQHLLTHKAQLRCNMCRVTFRQMVSLSMHLENVHNNVVLFCTTCCLSFKSKWDLNKHLEKHSNLQLLPLSLGTLPNLHTKTGNLLGSGTKVDSSETEAQSPVPKPGENLMDISEVSTSLPALVAKDHAYNNRNNSHENGIRTTTYALRMRDKTKGTKVFPKKTLPDRSYQKKIQFFLLRSVEQNQNKLNKKRQGISEIDEEEVDVKPDNLSLIPPLPESTNLLACTSPNRLVKQEDVEYGTAAKWEGAPIEEDDELDELQDHHSDGGDSVPSRDSASDSDYHPVEDSISTESDSSGNSSGSSYCPPQRRVRKSRSKGLMRAALGKKQTSALPLPATHAPTPLVPAPTPAHPYIKPSRMYACESCREVFPKQIIYRTHRCLLNASSKTQIVKHESSTTPVPTSAPDFTPDPASTLSESSSGLASLKQTSTRPSTVVTSPVHHIMSTAANVKPLLSTQNIVSMPNSNLSSSSIAVKEAVRMTVPCPTESPTLISPVTLSGSPGFPLPGIVLSSSASTCHTGSLPLMATVVFSGSNTVTRLSRVVVQSQSITVPAPALTHTVPVKQPVNPSSASCQAKTIGQTQPLPSVQLTNLLLRSVIQPHSLVRPPQPSAPMTVPLPRSLPVSIRLPSPTQIPVPLSNPVSASVSLPNPVPVSATRSVTPAIVSIAHSNLAPVSVTHSYPASVSVPHANIAPVSGTGPTPALVSVAHCTPAPISSFHSYPASVSVPLPSGAPVSVARPNPASLAVAHSSLDPVTVNRSNPAPVAIAGSSPALVAVSCSNPAPVAVVRSSLPPVTVARSSLSPVAVVRSSLAPVTVTRSSLAPVVVAHSNLAPVSVARPNPASLAVAHSSLDPVTVNRSNPAPVAIAGSSPALVAVSCSNPAPVAVVRSSLPPVTVARSSLSPVAVVRSSLAPVTVTRSSLAPVVVAHSNLASVAVAGSHPAPVAVTGTHPTPVTVAGSSPVPVSGSSPVPVAGSSLAPVAVAGSGLAPVAVAGSGLVAVAGSRLAPVAVAGSRLAPVAVAGSRLAPVAVAGSRLAPVTGSSFAPVALVGSNLAPVTVSRSNPAPVAVAGSGLAPVAVAGSGLAPVAVTGSRLAPVAVTGSSPAPFAVACSDLAPVTVTCSSHALVAFARANNAPITVNHTNTGTISASGFVPSPPCVLHHKPIAGSVPLCNSTPLTLPVKLLVPRPSPATLPVVAPVSTQVSSVVPEPLKIVGLYVNCSQELALQQRLKKTWRSKGMFLCRQCGAISRQPSLSVRHRYLHRGSREHRCYCGRTFQRRLHLLRHHVQHAEATRFVCAPCGQTFSGASCLARHKQARADGMHRKRRRRMVRKDCLTPFSCDCGQRFQRPTAFLWHKLKNHKSLKRF